MKPSKTIIQKSIDDGINLRGSRHAGKSASELRRDDPKLAARLVAEISGVLA